MPGRPDDPMGQHLYRFAAHLGIGVRGACDGRAIYRDETIPCDLTSSDVAHEIGHWWQAKVGFESGADPVDRRTVTNFGLGGDYQWFPGATEDWHLERDPTLTRIDAPVLIGHPDNQNEEYRASAAGIALQHAAGDDWYDTFLDHSWADDLWDDNNDLGDRPDDYWQCPTHTPNPQITCLRCVGTNFQRWVTEAAPLLATYRTFAATHEAAA